MSYEYDRRWPVFPAAFFIGTVTRIKQILMATNKDGVVH